MRLRKTKVLIVEDDRLISLVERKLLEQLNYEVVDVITKGEEVATAYEKHLPDLIILDICLAGETNGIEAARAIWHHSEVPIVFISGNCDLYKAAVSTFENPFHTFLSKPISRKQLADAIAEVTFGHSGRLKVA
ncbi:response regulator [Balneolaceae bacterium YR4-1]|uniref:Response regulator n=1 Tax=Halalkalibaculum roseum TaxID=2709311 RepID=A0A6M1SYK0_9BACT|nr:response regulator [Halalkalibaculum roseum]NGP77378.1 response regulator [Halalkalibaculum roseum]